MPSAHAVFRPRVLLVPGTACGGRTPYGSPCGYPWVTPRMRLTDFCFPTTSTYEHSRLVDSRDGHRAFARLLRGGPCVSRRGGPLRGGLRARVANVLFSSTGRRTDPLTPLSPPLQTPASLSLERAFQGPPDRFRRPPVKAIGFPGPGCLPSSSDLAPVAGRVSVAGSPGAAFPRSRGFAAAARFSTSLRAQLRPPVREASPAS